MWSRRQTLFLALMALMATVRPGHAVLVSGTIATEAGKPLVGLQVGLFGAGPIFTMTDDVGFYAFNVEPGLDFTVAPVAPDGPVSWVEQADLDLMTNHLLGIEPLQTPYLYLAADVNRDSILSTLDRVRMESIFNGTQVRFPENSDWTFVDASFTFSSPVNPWLTPIPAMINFAALTADSTGNDFVAIATGDLDGSANTILIPEPSMVAIPALMFLYAAIRRRL